MLEKSKAAADVDVVDAASSAAAEGVSAAAAAPVTVAVAIDSDYDHSLEKEVLDHPSYASLVYGEANHGFAYNSWNHCIQYRQKDVLLND